MPELPEVETIKRYLNKYVKNKTINKILVLHKKTIIGNLTNFKKNLINKKIIGIKRYGKYLIFLLNSKNVLISHLRMEGKYILGQNQKDKTKHARIIFYFDDGTILNYDDSRTFGRMNIMDKEKYLHVPPISKLGPEINKKINLKNFFNALKKSKRTIKEVLLDQKIVAGLGNIYVDETLFESKISPLTKANKLTELDASNILKNANKIVNLAIKFKGSFIKTYYFTKNETGSFQNFLKVYGKKGQKCVKCKKILIKIKINNRGTTYCPNCQILK